LIALQINNWNELRKTHRQDIEFLINLKVELAVDISALTERGSQYQRINDNIEHTIKLFDRGIQSLANNEHQEIVSALTLFQILTPINKNNHRNDLVIAQCTIDRIDKELNCKFISYLQETQSINAAITKLGETLQQLQIFTYIQMLIIKKYTPMRINLILNLKNCITKEVSEMPYNNHSDIEKLTFPTCLEK
jgi:hypothetical protein